MKLPILYIDTYLTDSQLHSNNKNFVSIFDELSEFREKNEIYKKKSKLEIFKYTLLSYASVKWKSVYVSFECENPDWVEHLQNYIYELFPDAIVKLTRSDSVTKFINNLSSVDADADDWIYFCPNNDHPIVCKKFLDFSELIYDAESQFGECSEDCIDLISISHFPEFVNSIAFGSPLYLYNGIKYKTVSDSADAILVETNDVFLDSLYLYKYSNLLNIFKSSTSNIGRVVRLEDLSHYKSNLYPRQRIYIRKNEICRHYDAYNHTKNYVKKYVDFSLCPPLFVPDGIFDGRLDINSICSGPYKSLLNNVPYFWRLNDSQNITSIPLIDDVNDVDRYTIKCNTLYSWARSIKAELGYFIKKLWRA